MSYILDTLKLASPLSKFCSSSDDNASPSRAFLAACRTIRSCSSLPCSKLSTFSSSSAFSTILSCACVSPVPEPYKLTPLCPISLLIASSSISWLISVSDTNPFLFSSANLLASPSLRLFSPLSILSLSSGLSRSCSRIFFCDLIAFLIVSVSFVIVSAFFSIQSSNESSVCDPQ